LEGTGNACRRRSVVRAASGYKDNCAWTWLLFEIPGGDWFYFAPDESPRTDRAEEFARTDLVVAQLSPHGPTLSVAATGKQLPIFGTSEDSDPYAQLKAGRTWQPRKGWENRYDDRVREHDLPAWVLESVGRRVGS
jgi:hypothetical protein